MPFVPCSFLLNKIYCKAENLGSLIRAELDTETEDTFRGLSVLFNDDTLKAPLIEIIRVVARGFIDYLNMIFVCISDMY